MSLAITVLDEFRLTWDNHSLDKFENRFSEYGAFYTFMEDTPKSIAGYQALVEARKDEDRTVSVVVGDAFNPVVGDTRSCTPSVDIMDTAYQTPYWHTLETGFWMNEAMNQGNYVTYKQQFDRQMDGVQRAFLETIDTACVAHLAANLSGVNNAEDNPYAIVADYMQVPAAENFNFFNEYGSIAMANDFSPVGHNVIGSSRTMSIVRGYQNQGAGNALNTAFQFAGYNFAYTNNITTASGDMAVMYLSPIGSLGILTWIDPDCRLEKRIGDHKMWSKIFLPKLGHEVGLYYTADCDDKSAIVSGLERTHVETFEFSYDYALLSSYNSTPLTVPGVIYGAQFLTT
jgi:hypothetical protein